LKGNTVASNILSAMKTVLQCQDHVYTVTMLNEDCLNN